MCGIFAWAGKNPSKFNRNKFDLLGIMNETRGRHSCGVTTDGEIQIGIDKNKVYRDFIQNVNYNKPQFYPHVIGHTRHATFGSHNLDNAHPFGFGNIETEVDGEKEYHYEFIGVHNGSLINHKDLAKAYNIDTTSTSKLTKSTSVTRYKIDSEILLECIYNNQDWKVLSEYNGAAALIFVNNNEPNVIYCYHGKSKEYNWKSSKEEEERPLHYYKETKNSLYISSIRKSLVLIGGSDKNIGEFEHNTVYKIVDGDISKATKFKVSRATNYQKESYSNSNAAQNCNFAGYVDTYDDEVSKYKAKNTRTAVNNSNNNIYDEKVDPNIFGNKIYLEKLRYYRNGHLINGIYCYIKGYNNIAFFGKTIKEATEYFYAKVNHPFYDGSFIPFNSEDISKADIPFIHKKGKEITHPPFLYFFNGVRLKDELDYESCIEAKKQKRNWGYMSLSCCSAHPIININTSYKGKNSQDILLDNDPFDGKIAPLLSKKIYNIKDGNLISWEYIESKDEEKAKNSSLVVVKSFNEIVDSIEEDAKNDKKENDQFLNDRLEKEIEEIFTGPYKKYPSILKQLDRYSHLPKGEEAIEIIETFIEGISNLITIEIKE